MAMIIAARLRDHRGPTSGSSRPYFGPNLRRPETMRPHAFPVMVTEQDIRRICLSLPGAVEKPYAGLPGFRVRNKLFARIRGNPDALVVLTSDVGEKEALIWSEPEKFFQTPHYEGHPAVLVRMEAIEVDELEDLLKQSWALIAPAKLVAAFESLMASRDAD